MTAHYLFDADFCNVASGWVKGRVAKGGRDVRRRIWLDAAQQRFGSFAELNVWLATQCAAARAAPCLDCPGLSIHEVWDHEQPQPMPTPFGGYVEVPARVSSTPCNIPSASSSSPIRACSKRSATDLLARVRRVTKHTSPLRRLKKAQRQRHRAGAGDGSQQDAVDVAAIPPPSRRRLSRRYWIKLRRSRP